jgi:ABC-type uncharacterized transport system substrate-binding protein
VLAAASAVLLALAGVMLARLAPATPTPGQVLVITSSGHAAYREFADALALRLGARRESLSLKVETADEYRRHTLVEQRLLTRDGLVVTVGLEAARAVAERPPPVPALHTLVPRLAFERLVAEMPGARGDSAIYLDQPFARQFALLRLALPHAEHVAVVLGPQSKPLRAEILAAARAQGFALRAETVESETRLHRELPGILEGTDALLVVADDLVYNARTIHHILLATYHRRIPVLGLSPAYLEAGTVLALYTTPDQHARQAAESILKTLDAPHENTPHLPPPQYPKYFTVGINERVAASLGLKLPEARALERALERLGL